MPAPYGNRNAESAWFTPISDEKSVVAQTRIPESVRKELQKLLDDGETMAKFYRDAILRERKISGEMSGLRA